MTILTRVEMLGRSLARKHFPRKPEPALDYDPYDKKACEHRAAALLEEMHHEPRRGAFETCQRILAIIAVSYPTEKLAAEYFSNLEILLGSMRRLEKPGQLVIGLGPGRCGSTSLAAMLGTIANSCCTHETPPLIFWDPESEQVHFHIRRFRMLADFYSLVADVSHWWLNPIEGIFAHFPDAKIIGLIRDPDDCALSFMRIQGFGKGSWNPWVARGNDLWRVGPWDPTYPSYPAPRWADKRPDRAKLEFIRRYVKEYNAQLRKLARDAPDSVLLVRTAELSRSAVQKGIFEMVRGHGQTSTWKLNVSGTADGKKNQIQF